MGQALPQPEEQSGVRAGARRLAGRGKGALRGTRAVVSVLIGDLVIPTSKKTPKSILWGFVLQINSWVGCTGRMSIDEGHQHGQEAKWTVPPPIRRWKDEIESSLLICHQGCEEAICQFRVHASSPYTINNTDMGEWIWGSRSSLYNLQRCFRNETSSFNVTEIQNRRHYGDGYCPSTWLWLASKGNRRWTAIHRCASIFHFHARLHTYSLRHMQAARADWFLANMIGNTGCAVSTGLIKSGQNYSRHSQQRIDALIMINGNRIIFSPDIVIALSHFCSSCSCFSNPPSPRCSPAIVSASAFWPHFLFSKPVHFSLLV